jgi:hypothetical protein
VLDGFAGDESMVIRSVGDGFETLTVFVRLGGLKAEIWQKDLIDVDEVRRLGIRGTAPQRAGRVPTVAKTND